MTWEEFIHNSFLIKCAAAVIELIVGFLLGPIVKRMIMKLKKRRGVDEGVLTFSGSMANIIIRLFAIIIALGQIGVDMTVIVGAFSAVGLGISLALKENMANVASGMQILLTRPFRVGDYIECQSLEGTVMSIEIMFTTLETFDNQQVVLPNTYLISNPVTNYSVYPSRRLALKVPVSTAVSPDEFRSRAKELMDSNPLVLKNPAPKTVIGDYVDNGKGIQIGLVCYARIEDYWDMKYQIQEGVQNLLNQLEIPMVKTVVEVTSA